MHSRNTQFYLTYQIVSVIQRFNLKGWFSQNAFKVNRQLENSSSFTDLQSVLLQSLTSRNGQGFSGDGTLQTNLNRLVSSFLTVERWLCSSKGMCSFNEVIHDFIFTTSQFINEQLISMVPSYKSEFCHHFPVLCNAWVEQVWWSYALQGT